MRIIDLQAPGAIPAILDAMERGPVILQLAPVYALFAPPTKVGASWLDDAKQRLSGKNYGSAIGSIDRFWACVAPESVPPELSVDQVGALIGAFVRFRFAPAHVDTQSLRAGTHQGLLLPEPWRGLMLAIEDRWADRTEPDLFGGHRYAGSLCTSCNLSGHPDGSIVDRNIALAFGEARGVELFATCAVTAAESGSFPILSFDRSGVTVGREGPRLRELLDQLPERVRPARTA